MRTCTLGLWHHGTMALSPIIFPFNPSFLCPAQKSVYTPTHHGMTPFLLVFCFNLLHVTTSPPFSECRPGYLGSPPSCFCYEEDTAYFGNNAKVGSDNRQPSMAACQASCAANNECEFWTWGKASPTGPCYLKTKRENVTPGLKSYVSGSKHCVLPPPEGNVDCLSWW